MAYHLYSKAKEKGHSDTIYRLGIAYHYGRGVDANNSEAIDCYTEAAKLGNTESQHMLGKLYIAGELVGKDPLKTLEWYTGHISMGIVTLLMTCISYMTKNRSNHTLMKIYLGFYPRPKTRTN
jgi:TPR repeat protein